MPKEYYFLLGGTVLLAIELALPGFGVCGVAGLLALTLGAFYLLGGGLQALAAVSAVYLLLALAIAFCCLYLPRESRWNPFVLWEKQRADEPASQGGRDMAAFAGRTGVALTPLRPAGTIMLDGERFDAASLGDYIAAGEAVQVAKVESGRLLVKKIKQNKE